VTDLLPLLQEFYREKLLMMLRHQAGARVIAQYDANNTYQYIVNREDLQLTWVSSAIAELGGTAADVTDAEGERIGNVPDVPSRVLEDDVRDAQAFVDRWTPRIRQMTNARHAKMLRVIVGETLEQKRFFEQALAGRTDLLGRRPDHVGPRIGEVLPTRWIE
jgi:hypothetical protein